MAQNAVMIAGLTSGAGKTLVTLGLLRACARRGFDISAAKTGPDFIDTAFLAAASGKPAVNLDTFAMPAPLLSYLAQQQPGSTLFIEGVMGVFDGGPQGVGSSAGLASALGVPIILVLDVRHTAQTAAMLAAGLKATMPNTPIAGVILNHVASARHQALIDEALAQVNMPQLGALPNCANLEIPSRHLGLVQADDLAADGQLITILDAAADFIDQHCDLEAIIQLAGPLPPASPPQNLLPPPAQHIAIAKDAAFGFCYDHILHGWQKAGATLHLFSPLNDDAPADDTEFIYIPGGYPELHLPILSGAQNCFAGLRQAAERDCLIYGECGGFMMLGTAITDAQGGVFKMANLLDLHTSFANRKRHLGYRKFFPKNGFFWQGPMLGHEFHYTSAIHQRGDALFDAEDGSAAALGTMGLKKGNICGSYGHIIAPA